METLLFVASLLGGIAVGLPIAYAILASSLLVMAAMGEFDLQAVVQGAIAGVDSFVLMAVPFFILAGELMNAGGLSRRIVGMAMAFVGHLRGGMGYVAVIAAVILASLSGSAVADTAALGSILIPMLRQAGYGLERSCGLIASGGIIAPIIAFHRVPALRGRRKRFDHQAFPCRGLSGSPDGSGIASRMGMAQPFGGRDGPAAPVVGGTSPGPG